MSPYDNGGIPPRDSMHMAMSRANDIEDERNKLRATINYIRLVLEGKTDTGDATDEDILGVMLSQIKDAINYE